MADNDKKPFAHLLPAILTGAAALIAALTGVYVNLRGDMPARQDVDVAVATPAARSTTGAPARPTPVPANYQLQVERIAVRHDGSPGTTDWRFEVTADDEPLFVFGQDGLDDSGGRNVALPDDASAKVRAGTSAGTRIGIKAWRGSRLRIPGAGPDATGGGLLRLDGSLAPIEVVATKPAAGSFVFYFSAVPD